MNKAYVTIPFTYLKNVLPYVKGTIYENKINEYLSKTEKYSITEITVPAVFIGSICCEIRKSKGEI